VSKSAASRHFVALSAQRMKTWMETDLSGLDLLVVQIDGIHITEHLVLVAAIGIDGEGIKHPLGLMEGATENASVVQALIDNLVERGLDPTRRRLFIIDGSKALSKAIRRTFGRHTPIQRCQIHKARNIMDRLAPPLHASVRRVLRQAWEMDDAEKAEKLIRNLARRLEHDAPGVSQSLLEGLDEIQRAWRQGYYGLAAVIAVAWDTMVSPIDVRQLTAGQRVRDDQGALFFVDRAKTGRAAAGTLSRWSSAILDAYLGRISVVPVGDAPLFRNRSGAPYSKDTLGDDFRAVRTMVFGKNDDRQLADIRRSGAVEATVGGAKVEKLAKKMANTISASTRLQKVYNPVDVESVRSVDRSREQARRERKANEKCHRRRPESVTKTDPKR
jgi:hypothetical protein